MLDKVTGKKNPAARAGLLATCIAAADDPVDRCQLSPGRVYAPDISRHHEHLNFPAETSGALLRLLSRGPRVHPRVVSFLTTHSKLVAALPVPASIPELSSVVVSYLLRERLVRISANRALWSLSRKFFSRQYLPAVIVLIPVEVSMSQFAYKRQNDRGLGATARGEAPGLRPQGSEAPDRSQRGRRTLTRTPRPPGRVVALALPPWNSAMRRTM